MDSNTHQSFQPQQLQNHQPTNPPPPPTTGLLRFRSAPSSLLMSCADAAKADSSEGFEAERLISRFMNCNDSVSPNFNKLENNKPPPPPPAAAAAEAAGGVNFTNSPRGYSGLPPHYPRQNSLSTATSMDSSYGLVACSMAMDLQQKQLKPVNVNPIPNLMRQNSSPAGLFSQFPLQNGFAAIRGTMGDYRLGNGTNGELSPSTKRLKSQLSLSSRLPSSLGMLSQISEIGNEGIEESSPGGDGKVGYQFGSWNDSLHFTDNFTAMKTEQEDDDNLFSGSQNGELGNRVHILSHHLSLPKTSAEIVAVEKLLQFQDSVPCKIRAKRGCATHPRSIAERVRRTRISERMRKLQELVPNMDKQTNTADMLDLAVEYIKDLQKTFKTLSDNRANCKCMSMPNPVSNQTV